MSRAAPSAVTGSYLSLDLNHVSEHDFRSGVHNGLVSVYNILILGAGHRSTNGIVYRVSAKNVLNNRHWEFVSGAEIGVVVVGEVEFGF